MSTELEIRKEQKRHLYQLKAVKKDPSKIDEMIQLAEVEMEAEDVAYVEKKVANI